MRRTRPLAVATSVAIALSGLAGTAFALTNDATGSSTKAGRTSKQALALLDRYEADQATSERAAAEFHAVVAEREKFLAGVAAEEQRQAEEAARAERARRARADALADQRASRSATAAPAPRRSPAYGPWADLINQYPWPADVAYRVMMCESRGDANAYNPRSGATGLFQILNGPFDPAANVALAYDMWSSRGWQPWSACI